MHVIISPPCGYIQKHNTAYKGKETNHIPGYKTYTFMNEFYRKKFLHYYTKVLHISEVNRHLFDQI